MLETRDVNPGDLRLPPSREHGPVPSRYYRQVRRFGNDIHGMPPIEVSEGEDGEFVILNGVTRAFRAYYRSRVRVVTVLVTDRQPAVNLSHLKRVRDVQPP